jgi:hypothetical protein
MFIYDDRESQGLEKKEGRKVKKALVSAALSVAMVLAPLPALQAATPTAASRPAASPTGPMAPGGAAGVKQAQGGNKCQSDGGPCIPVWWWVAGGGALIGLGILAFSNNDNNNTVIPGATTTTTTTTTSTTTSGTTAP